LTQGLHQVAQRLTINILPFNFSKSTGAPFLSSIFGIPIGFVESVVSTSFSLLPEQRIRVKHKKTKGMILI
jgi:hypothetical protein